MTTAVGRPNSADSDHGPVGSNVGVDYAETRPMYGLSEVFRVPNTPGAPTGLTASPIGQTQIDLAWTAPLRDRRRHHRLPHRDLPRRRRDVGRPSLRHHQHRHGLLAHRPRGRTVRHYRVSAISSEGAGTTSNVARGETRPAPVNVPSNWSLIPSGLTTGDTFACCSLLHRARRQLLRHRRLQHLHPGDRRGRRLRHPALQRGLQGGRLHRRRRRPRQHRHHLQRHRQGRAHLLAQRRQGGRRVRGLLRRGLGQRGQRQGRVRRQRPRYQQLRQLPHTAVTTTARSPSSVPPPTPWGPPPSVSAVPTPHQRRRPAQQ